MKLRSRHTELFFAGICAGHLASALDQQIGSEHHWTWWQVVVMLLRVRVNGEQHAADGAVTPVITVEDVEAYRAVHYPEHVAHDYKPGHGRPERVPSDAYVARLGHERFHEWFGRVCDHTCPHLHGGRAANAAPLPLARIARAPWWRRLLAWMEPRTIRRCAHCDRVIAEDMHLLRRCESGCGRGRGAGDVCTTLVWS